MKKMMKCLVLAMAVLIVASTAWCWDFNDHVKIAPNNQGDMLIYPFYAAINGGWETKVWVVNTSPNRSVIAHLAFYSARTSVELLDFFIFLTPTDVWNGTVRWNSTSGTAELYSTDDSIMTGPGVFASPTNPVVRAFINPVRSTCLQSAEPFGNQLGYMVLLEAAHSDNTAASTSYRFPRGTQTTVNLNLPPVPKGALYEAYNDFLAAAGISAPVAGNINNNPLVLDGINVLAGHLEFKNTLTGQNSTVQATTLRDYDNQLPVGYGASIGFAAGCGYAGGAGVTPAVAAAPASLGGAAGATIGCQAGGGPAFSMTGTTQLGAQVCTPTAAAWTCAANLAGFGSQTNSIGEVEAALAKDWLAMPFTSKNLTVHFMTFPTKQTIRNSQDCYYVSSPSPFFSAVGANPRVSQPVWPFPGTRPSGYSNIWEGWGCFQYQTASYDLSENSSTVTSIFSPGGQPQSLCGEMNIATGFAFDEGWSVYNFNGTSLGNTTYATNFDTQADIIPGVSGVLDGNDARYTGAPVIGTVISLGSDGLTLLPTSYADGTVTNLATATIYHYYQYWDQANINDGVPGTSALVNASPDEFGCGNLPCAVNANALVAGTNGGNIYMNKFSGNRSYVLPATTFGPTTSPLLVTIPAGTTFTSDTALTIFAPANISAIPAATATTAPITTDVYVPAGTTFTGITAGVQFTAIPISSGANLAPLVSPDLQKP